MTESVLLIAFVHVSLYVTVDIQLQQTYRKRDKQTEMKSKMERQMEDLLSYLLEAVKDRYTGDAVDLAK